MTARDNPLEDSNFNTEHMEFIVNFKSKENYVILVIGDAEANKILKKKNIIVDTISQITGLIVMIEKVTSRQYIGENNTLVTDPMNTDVWFYVIDPETDLILKNNDTKIQR